MYPDHKIPLPGHDRIIWNDNWERDVKQFFEVCVLNCDRVATLFQQNIGAELMKMPPTEAGLLTQESARAGLRELQHDLAERARVALATDDFERKWKALTAQKRTALLLEGIARTAATGVMVGKRRWCPDLTVDSLAQTGGSGYIHILTLLVSSYSERTSTGVALLPHPEMDRFFRVSDHDRSTFPGLEAHVESMRIDRAYFTTMVVWNTFLDFYGEEEETVVIKAQHHSPQERKAMRRLMKDDGTLRGISQEWKQERKEQADYCWNCRKDAGHIGGNNKLRACTKCASMGRQINYCSKKCQRMDWPRHRAICGKPLASAHDLSLHEQGSREDEEPDDFADGFPVPVPPFKWSPALQYQVSLLRKEPIVDYVIVYPYPLPDRGLAIPNMKIKISFRVARYEALKDGNAEIVLAMYYMLVPWLGIINFDRAKLRTQLESEFATTIDTSRRPIVSSLHGRGPSSQADTSETMGSSSSTRIEEIQPDDDAGTSLATWEPDAQLHSAEYETSDQVDPSEQALHDRTPSDCLTKGPSPLADECGSNDLCDGDLFLPGHLDVPLFDVHVISSSISFIGHRMMFWFFACVGLACLFMAGALAVMCLHYLLMIFLFYLRCYPPYLGSGSEPTAATWYW